MAVDTDTALGVGLSAVGVELILPEAATEHGRLAGVAGAHADGAQLAVAAAHHHGGALGEAGLGSALGAYLAGNLAALQHGGEDVLPQAAATGDGGIPSAALQVHEAGGGAVAGLHSQHAGELIDQPVVEHANGGGLLVDFGHLVLDPQDTGDGVEGVALAGLGIELLLQLRIALDQLSHLIVAAGVHVGAGPDLLALLVIEEDALPHAGGGDGGYVGGSDAGLFQHAPDTAAGQLPVVFPVEIHAAGEAGILLVSPLLLHAADLVAVQIEQDSANAAGSGVNCHQVFGHKNHQLLKILKFRTI